MRSFFDKYYPAGLEGKDFLDVGCNSGGYCFLAHELGARCAVGIEIRDHWLAQAELIKNVKYPKAKTVRFEREDAGAYLRRSPKKTFDIVLFKGIFFHLADPIHALMGYCDLATDTLLVDTPCSYKIPENCLQPVRQSRTHLMNGIDGLGWVPGGPRAIQQILRQSGFEGTDIIYWRGDPNRSGWGRFRIVGKRRT
jgi:tRNA (mo5U34)-methyltransferase